MTALVFAALALGETPEATVQAFVDALNRGDLPAMARQVAGKTRTDYPLSKWSASLKATVGLATVQGDDAHVEVDLALEDARAGTQRRHDTVRLHRENGDWRIVPTRQTDAREFPSIGLIANIVTDDPRFPLARQAASQTRCLSNLKQIGLATMLYANDHNDTLPKDPSRWKAALMPYVKNEGVFHCPDDPSGNVSYFLDPRVAGKSLVTIPAPAGTATVVEGTPKKTAFRHRGRASIAYADGHVRIASPEMVLKARTAPLK